MRDYGDLLTRELNQRGVGTQAEWLSNDGVVLGDALVASMKYLRAALSVSRGSVVIWNYSPFVYAYRGVPLPGVLFGIVLRARRIPVITVLHELAYPWGRRGFTGCVFAITQRAALLPVLAGSTAVVVTTTQRAASVHRRTWPVRRAAPLAVPVFSTLGEKASEIEREPAGHTIGVIGYGSDGAQPGLLFAAIRQLRPTEGMRIVLLGAPGPDSREGKEWIRAAATAGLQDTIEFTGGQVSIPELSASFAACDVITLVDEEGPSSRRTMLAAALAHGRATIATDGPNRWDAPVDEGAIRVVAAEPVGLGQALQRILDDPSERSTLGERASRFYQREMSLRNTADIMSALIAQVTGARE